MIIIILITPIVLNICFAYPQQEAMKGVLLNFWKITYEDISTMKKVEEKRMVQILFENGDYIFLPRGATIYELGDQKDIKRDVYLVSMKEYNKFLEEMKTEGFNEDREGLNLIFTNDNKKYRFLTYFNIKGYVILQPLSFYTNQNKLDYKVIVI